MELTIELVLIALIVMVLNVLDSVTTSLAFRQYPDKGLKGEANPLMRKLMLKNGTLAEVVKQGAILAGCICLVVLNDIDNIRLVALMLGFVVLNNTFIVVSRAITKRKVVSPFKRLQAVLHFSDKYTYIVMLVIIIGLALTINKVLW